MNQAVIIYPPPNSRIKLETIFQVYQDFGGISLARNKPEVIEVRPKNKTSIGIDQVRSLIFKLSYGTSANNVRMVVIQPADLLTSPAQNSLLKTLESPPPNTYINLVTAYPNKLIETVRSRCQLVHLNQPKYHNNQDSSQQTNPPQPYLPTSYHQVIELSNQLKHKEAALQWLETFIKTKPTSTSAYRLVVQAYQEIQSNVNTRLALEHYLFQALVDLGE